MNPVKEFVTAVVMLAMVAILVRIFLWPSILAWWDENKTKLLIVGIIAGIIAIVAAAYLVYDYGQDRGWWNGNS